MVSEVTKMRHKGEGPDRHTLPSSAHMDTLPKDIVQSLLEMNQRHIDVNQVNVEEHPVCLAEHSKLADTMKDKSRLLSLMDLRKGADPLDEKSYTEWNEWAREVPEFILFMNDHFPNAFRVRINTMRGYDDTIPWHIDTNSKVSLRCHIPLTHPYREGAIEFMVRRRNKEIDLVKAAVGSVTLVNTALPHSVINRTGEPRHSIVFGIEWKDLDIR